MILISFNDFIRKCKLEIRAASIIKNYQVLSSLSMNDIGIFLRDGSFKTDIGVVNLHASKGTHWVLYMNENYFDSYGSVCPKKIISVH